MQRLFNIIGQAPPRESKAVISATAEAFGDPVSIVLCTMGLCIGIIWLFWFGGFRALRKAPTRRFRRGFILWPLAILSCWIILMAVIQTVVTTEAVSYPVNAALEITLITVMLFIAHKSFARGLKGFGINEKKLIKDPPWAVINLIGTFPLILLGLWVSLTLGRIFKGADYSLEIHQTLDILTDANIGLRVLIIIFAALIVPVFEELLFRGFFQTALRSLSNSPWIGILLTSIFFAILHPPTHIPALFMLSCGLGYAYERSGSLFRPILMHILFNGFSVAMTLLMSQ